MDHNFGIQISPDLIISLVDPDYYQRRSRLPRSPPKPKPSPPLPPPPQPLVPPALVPPLLQEDAELQPLRKVIAECEQVVDSLRKQEATARQEAQHRAKELYEKQYKANQPKPFPCAEAHQACLQCYQENSKDALKCQDAVKAYAECAQQVRQRFVSAGFT